MTTFSAPLFRGIAIVGIGAVLATGHILFAAAAPAPAQTVPASVTVSKAADVETTSAVSTRPPVRENCYSEQHVVRSVRGKAMMLSTLECD